MRFSERWRSAVAERGTVLCAGLDPADPALGRGDKGLPAGVDKHVWVLNYVRAVAPFCAALKPNMQYFKALGDIQLLEDACSLAHELGLLVIEDAKLADIGESNDAALFAASRRADAVTFAPFAGNLEEAVQAARRWGVEIIVLCLMSNPEFHAEKKMQVHTNQGGMSRYQAIAREAARVDAAGLVVGAPSQKNHISEDEIAQIASLAREEQVFLVPGIGAQGGDERVFWRHVTADRVIVSVGRSVMYPRGGGSTSDDQAQAAQMFRNMIDERRQ